MLQPRWCCFRCLKFLRKYIIYKLAPNLLGVCQPCGNHMKRLSFCQSFANVITWDAQAVSFQTPAAHTTENSNWDVREEKVKLNFGEKA